MKLEINYRKENGNRTNVETKQHATKIPMDQWRTQRRNQKIPWDKWKWKHNTPKSMGCSKSSSKREVYSDTGLSQKTRKISNKQLNLPPKRIRKRTNKAQSQQKEGNNKDQRGNKLNRNKQTNKNQ